MGILNVTPDSFSDGGRYFGAGRAREHAWEMVEQGADIIDIGGESTRPGAVSVGAAEELRRLMPVLESLVAEDFPVPISVDTYRAETAREALACGAHMLNDIWGLKADPELAAVAAAYRAPVILMHNQHGTEYRDLMEDVRASLRRSVELAVERGVPREQVVIDPGIGFGKDTAQNLKVLKHLRQLQVLGRPILLGTSRKSVIGNTLGLPVDERLEGTAATVAWGIAQGADIVRVHEVKEMVRVARMMDAIILA
ncbi:MAG: dihydropteroate synthase [Clostridia bacterium]|nr:MAG: dihydropteroate synthase [Clostridia bacterium]